MRAPTSRLARLSSFSSLRTEQAHVHWIRRFILFYGKRHPADMGVPEKEVLGLDLPWLQGVKPPRLPVVLGEEEVGRLFACLDGTSLLVASLLYGSGLRLMEALCLRVKDVDLVRREITVRSGKGDEDRRTVLTGTLVGPLRSRIERVKVIDQQEIQNGLAPVFLPYALKRKYPNAGWGVISPLERFGAGPGEGAG